MPIEQRKLIRSHLVPIGDRIDREPGARLPVPLSPLVGREREIAAAANMLLDKTNRLVTLTGPGGVGKTRLALEVATQVATAFTDGVDFVDLSAIHEPEFVAPAIAQSLGIRRVEDQPVAATLKTALHHRELLLVLDNFEQVIEAATMVGALLQACPHLTALVTSRAALQISGERGFPVPPLTLPSDLDGGGPRYEQLAESEAVRLFVDRSRAVQPAFGLTGQNAQAIAAICTRLDGLPLAIELAAARGALFPPEELLSRLEQRLSLLTAGARDMPARQQTMRDTIVWSHDLLSPEERAVFRQLAVFVGGFTLEAAEQVCRPVTDPSTSPSQTADLAFVETVESLLRQCLLQPATAQPGARPAGPPRLTMLETVREFAAEELAAGGESETASRHAAFCLSLVSKAEPSSWGDEPGDWRPTINAELGNLRSAMIWAVEHDETDAALQLASALNDPHWMFDYHWLASDDARNQRAWVQRAIAMPGGSTSNCVKAMISAAYLAEAQEDLAESLSMLNDALALARDQDDALGYATAAFFRGRAVYREGDLSAARQWLTAALDGFRAQHARGRAAWTLCFLASLDSRLAIDEGGEMADLVQADSHCQEALATFREVDYLPGIIRALHGLAYVSYKLRDFARSLSLTHELLNLAWTHQRPVYDYLDDIADIAGRIGQPEVAARLYGAAMAERRRHGSVLPPVFQAEFEDDLAVALRALGEEQFEAAWEAGGAMAVELAVAEALAFTATGLTSLQVSLTPREQQILPLLAEGKTAREIGAILFLSHRTVENHIANLCSKLGVRTRAEAVEVALAGGLITPGSDAQLGNQPSEIE